MAMEGAKEIDLSNPDRKINKEKLLNPKCLLEKYD